MMIAYLLLAELFSLMVNLAGRALGVNLRRATFVQASGADSWAHARAMSAWALEPGSPSSVNGLNVIIQTRVMHR